MTKSRFYFAFPLFLIFILCIGLNVGGPIQEASAPKSPEWGGDFADGWRQFEEMTENQKYEAASSLIEKMLEKAIAQKNSGEWTRCLIRTTQLRTALHGYETAVRFLKEQHWPEDGSDASVLDLFYAHSLVVYASSYSWEINKRERVDTKGTVDLKAWTRDQIYEEARKAYEGVWKNRVQLGDRANTEWKEYLNLNTYPPGIRPTLRDAVSYLFVEMLADTNGWKPEQLNEIYRLNLKDLIGEAGGQSVLADPDRHPLEKISCILADLESWHNRKEEREAALEARLERCRQLHQRFEEAEDRKAIQDDLENRLHSLTDIPWWSEGMAQLAEFIRGGDEPDALIRARQIAVQGRKRFPESVGGKHCLSIQKYIEAPHYNIDGMQNDNPKKKSLRVTHKNLDRVFFRAYPVDLMNQIETSDDFSFLPSGRDLENFISRNSPVHEWEAPLPATPDYRMHKTFVVPPITAPGTYLIVASARRGFEKENNLLHGIAMTIGDLVLVVRQESGEVEITVLHGSNGKPLAGAEVMLYRYDYGKRHRRTESVLSDKRGMARFSLGEPRNARYFLVARYGDQIAYDPQQLHYYARNRREQHTATLLFTDRSIYRPLQKLYWKAVLYTSDPDEIRFETSPASTFTVLLKDMNHQVVGSKTVTTNSYGTASGEFFIPAGRTLGQWYLESSRSGRTGVRVEEYKRPTFEAEMLDPEEPLRLNRPAVIKGQAKYYFGLPVTGGRAKWVVRRQAIIPMWWGYSLRIGYDFRSSRSQIIDGGTEALKEDGTFSFTFLPEADERLGKNKDISYRYSVSVDVTDEGGETRSAARSFRLGFVSIEAEASPDKSFFLEETPVSLNVRRRSLDGVPKSGKGNWKIVSLKGPLETLLPAEQPVFIPEELKDRIGYRTPGDLERERWQPNYDPEEILTQWEEGPVRASGSVLHDEKGEARICAPHLAAGAYRLIYETIDDFGEKCELKKNFIVAAATLNLPLPAMFLLEDSPVKVGDTARLLVHSGIKDQFMVFETYRDGKCIRRQELNSGENPSILEIPITEKDRGGLGFALTLLRDNQFVRLTSSMMVPWDNKELKVEFSTFRNRLRPGNEEKWSVRVTGPAGRDVAVPAAELLAYMYDRSLDAFASHSPSNPIHLYPNRNQTIQARSSISEANHLSIGSSGFNHPPSAPHLIGDRLQFYSGYGIGGVGRRQPIRIGGNLQSLVDKMPYEEKGEGFAGVVGGIPTFARAPMPVARSSIVLNEVPIPDSKMTSDLGAQPSIELRSDFSETAFWKPHLLTNKDGSVTFEFKVPDSVTSWNVWVHAITRDLKSGFVRREAESVKELMVRPYLPRFLREGDQAEIKVVVNNASDRELQGKLNFDIIDVATDQSILSDFGLSGADASGKPFTAAAGGGANLSFPIKTPSRVGQIAFKVTASSGDFSDGELRPIPILPGRMHLMQSRFVTLKDASRRVMRFEDLARNDDPTLINDRMVVTLDAQLFYSVLSALPYLVNYPYECTEQTLNRFFSTGILSSLYSRYPAIERMAKEFSSRETPFEQWAEPDPNRKMALEETPWLRMAQGGEENASDLINVLDGRIAKAQRESALAKLRKSQTSSGGFPWFPGGPPSPYMTLYLLNGFSKALEFGVEVPRDMVKPAWDYMHRHYLDEIVKAMMSHDSGWEFVTFINYVLSNYPDASWYEKTFTSDERATMLDFSFKHWKEHSPYLKGYLALTLKRMERARDAMLVWESVMDSAKTAEDQGTFWAPEDRAWLWYNDTIETHAFAVRTEMELIPDDPKLDGLVLWLFLNKKMNHWKSTRATAEVVYSLAHYLKETGQLGVREDAAVTVGNLKTSFVFEPDEYTGKKNQIVIPGEKIDPQTTSTVVVEKSGKGHLFASATWHFSTERLPEEERGDYLRLSRTYYKRVSKGQEYALQPIGEGAALQPGDEVEVHLSVASKHPMEYVHLRDPRGAGFEPSTHLSTHKWDLGIFWYEEIRDSGTNFFFEHLPQGEYTFKYRIRAATAGVFKVAPATLQPMYAPEFAAYSSGAALTIDAQ